MIWAEIKFKVLSGTKIYKSMIILSYFSRILPPQWPGTPPGGRCRGRAGPGALRSSACSKHMLELTEIHDACNL